MKGECPVEEGLVGAICSRQTGGREVVSARDTREFTEKPFTLLLLRARVTVDWTVQRTGQEGWREKFLEIRYSLWGTGHINSLRGSVGGAFLILNLDSGAGRAVRTQACRGRWPGSQGGPPFGRRLLRKTGQAVSLSQECTSDTLFKQKAVFPFSLDDDILIQPLKMFTHHFHTEHILIV